MNLTERIADLLLVSFVVGLGLTGSGCLLADSIIGTDAVSESIWVTEYAVGFLGIIGVVGMVLSVFSDP